MHRAAVLIATITAAALPGALPAAAQGRADGVYPGMLVCDALPFSRGPLRAPLSLTIAGGQARYSRKLTAADGAGSAGATESGSGPIAGGQLTLVGTARGKDFGYEARYSGTVDGRGGLLIGTQTWTVRGQTHRRTCQIAIGLGR